MSQRVLEFRWEDDPDFDGTIPPCPRCFSEMEALRVTPDRSNTYMRAIFLCKGDRLGPDGKTCRFAWPRDGGARRFTT